MDPPVFGQARSETALRPLIHNRIGHICGDRGPKAHTRRLRRKVAPQEFVLGGMPPRPEGNGDGVDERTCSGVCAGGLAILVVGLAILEVILAGVVVHHLVEHS